MRKCRPLFLEAQQGQAPAPALTAGQREALRIFSYSPILYASSLELTSTHALFCYPTLLEVGELAGPDYLRMHIDHRAVDAIYMLIQSGMVEFIPLSRTGVCAASVHALRVLRRAISLLLVKLPFDRYEHIEHTGFLVLLPAGYQVLKATGTQFTKAFPKFLDLYEGVAHEHPEA